MPPHPRFVSSVLALGMWMASGAAWAQFPAGDGPLGGPPAGGDGRGYTPPERDRGPAEPPFRRTPPPDFGVMLDAGIPDGAMASLAYRPVSWFRTYAGGGSNSVSGGLRGGVAALPLGLGPSLTVEGGHYFAGDANDLARFVRGRGYADNPMVASVGYDFVNLHLGMETGGKHFNLFIHGGMSYVRFKLHHADEALGSGSTNPDGSPLVSFSVLSDPLVQAFIPSVKLGFCLFLV